MIDNIASISGLFLGIAFIYKNGMMTDFIIGLIIYAIVLAIISIKEGV